MNTVGVYKCLSCGRLWEIPLIAVPDIKLECHDCHGKLWKVGEFNLNAREVSEYMKQWGDEKMPEVKFAPAQEGGTGKNRTPLDFLRERNTLTAVKNIKKKKEELENHIREIIRKFEKETGCIVKDILISRGELMIEEVRYVRVNVQVV